MAEPTEVDSGLAAADALLTMRETQGWKILMLQLEADGSDAKDELALANAEETSKIRRLQNRVKRLYWFRGTIEELIQSGLAPIEVAEAEAEEGGNG